MSIRRKLALVTLLLLALPITAIPILREVEQLLTQQMLSGLLQTARAQALLLSQTGKQSGLEESPQQTGSSQLLYVSQLPNALQLDGFDDDWQAVKGFKTRFTDQGYVMASLSNSRLHLFLSVPDDDVVYRGFNDTTQQSDRLEVHLNGERFLLMPEAPGKLVVQSGADAGLRADFRFNAIWQETSEGHQVEIRFPIDVLAPLQGDSSRNSSKELSLVWRDVDRQALKGAQQQRVLPRTDQRTDRQSWKLRLPSPPIENLLARIPLQTAQRIWVLDGAGQVLARRGDIQSRHHTPPVNPLFGWFLRPPQSQLDDPRDYAVRLQSAVVKTALDGQAATAVEAIPDANTAIFMAAAPIAKASSGNDGGKITGVLVLEQSSGQIQLLQRSTLARLLNVFLLIFLLVAGALALYATRLAWRIRKLSQQADDSIDEQGRVQGVISASAAKDEIGDLNRHLARLTERLSGYHDYLEKLAPRLSHELRTPIAVMSTSLDNLSLESLTAEGEQTLTRARQGLRRISQLINRMSEATRLEQSLSNFEKERVNLSQMLHQMSEAFATTFAHPFRFESHQSDYCAWVAPELVAQAVEKLAANALDFSDPRQPIIIRLDNGRQDDLLHGNVPHGNLRHENLQQEGRGAMWRISVINSGSQLPDMPAQQLFQSMTSIRRRDDESAAHLGLGLYVVKLVADFHDGQVVAENLDERRVRFGFTGTTGDGK